MRGQSSLSSLWTPTSSDMRVEMRTMFHHVVGQQQCAGEATSDKNTDRLYKLAKNDETWPTTPCRGVDHPESTEGYQGQSSPELRPVGLCTILSYFMSCLFLFQCAVVWLEVWMLFLCFDEVRRSWIYFWGWMKYLAAGIESPACQWNHMSSVGSVASTFKGI